MIGRGTVESVEPDAIRKGKLDLGEYQKDDEATADLADPDPGQDAVELDALIRQMDDAMIACPAARTPTP